ncbi:hypothetical protein C2S53_008360 [Perilla frutescens var. hirtella]|uniref:Protein phosphatase n=1 Tax=Perilla frutescens var. hirtella TaxID=608512 RepID=A0AAD4PAM5_PERFH|nr:hypothetical protein C2S53_008360 [Perilla frutescens var. hirtella]
MVADSHYIPKDNRNKPRGEDAHFFCRKAQVIGVADGVGGWAKRGIDAGEYARQLMTNAAASVENSSPADVDPKSVLVHAHRKTAAPGSSTACIISLAGNRLRAANVGDSGFAVIRGGKTVYRSPVQQHSFNTPYQIGIAGRDRPEAAAEVAVGLESGDVVVAATDGLFDNVFPEEVETTVELCMTKYGVAPAPAARELAVAARRKSLERDTGSPFEAAARDAGFKGRGGKRDDITVVVAYVIRDGILDSLSNFALSWVKKKIFSWIYLEPLYYYAYAKSFYELNFI